MKAKLMYGIIFLICLCCVIGAGLLSVSRSEGRILSPEVQAHIEAFVEGFAKE